MMIPFDGGEAKALLEKYLNRMKVATINEYQEISRIYKTLGEHKNAGLYQRIPDKA